MVAEVPSAAVIVPAAFVGPLIASSRAWPKIPALPVKDRVAQLEAGGAEPNVSTGAPDEPTEMAAWPDVRQASVVVKRRKNFVTACGNIFVGSALAMSVARRFWRECVKWAIRVLGVECVSPYWVQNANSIFWGRDPRAQLAGNVIGQNDTAVAVRRCAPG